MELSCHRLKFVDSLAFELGGSLVAASPFGLRLVVVGARVMTTRTQGHPMGSYFTNVMYISFYRARQ